MGRSAEGGATPHLDASVVIPFHRGLRLLDVALACLAAQTYASHRLEVIIVEDGSPVDTAKLVERWSPTLRLRRLRLPREGPRRAKARNTGIEMADGDVIISLDSDMALPPDAVASHMRWFATSEPVATFGLRRFIDASTLLADWCRTPSYVELAGCAEITSESNLAGRVRDVRTEEVLDLDDHPYPYNCFHGCNVAYMKADAIAVGSWNEAFDGNYGYEDIEFGYRLHRHGVRFVHEPSADALHLEGEAMTRADRLSEALVNRAKLYAIVPELESYRRVSRARS